MKLSGTHIDISDSRFSVDALPVLPLRRIQRPRAILAS